MTTVPVAQARQCIAAAGKGYAEDALHAEHALDYALDFMPTVCSTSQ